MIARVLACWPTGRGYRAIAGSVSGIGARFVLAGVTLATVPLLVHHLGSIGYGIWATLTAGVAWLALAQFGLGPALLNRLSALRDPSARHTAVWTGWWFSLGVGAIVFVVLAIGLTMLPWTDFLNIETGPWSDEARLAAVAFAAGFAAGIPVSVPLTVLRARQQVYLANAIEALAAIARFLALLLLIDQGAGLAVLAVGSTVAALTVLAIGGWVAVRRRESFGPPQRPHAPEARGLLRSGSVFTIVSLAGLLIIYTDSIVISQALGPAAVTPYAAAFTLLTFCMSLILAILDAAWPALTEAASGGEWRWLSRALDRLVIVAAGVASAFGVALVVTGSQFINAWVGPTASPPPGLLFVLAGVAVVQAIELPHGRVLVSTGRLRPYAAFGLGNAMLNLILSIVLVRAIGTTGVAVATLVGYLVFGPGLIYLTRRSLNAARFRDPVTEAIGVS